MDYRRGRAPVASQLGKDDGPPPAKPRTQTKISAVSQLGKDDGPPPAKPRTQTMFAAMSGEHLAHRKSRPENMSSAAFWTTAGAA